MSQTTLQPAYVLHARAYRDTSLLLELFTQEFGRISVVARGARGPRSQFKGLLQPFVPLLVSYFGKTELMTLTTAETNGWLLELKGDQLLCGFYLNELLVRLLHRYDAHPQLFQQYQLTLRALQSSQQQQMVLREFEKCLLAELGYALQLDRDAASGMKIDPQQFYYFDPLQGLLSSDHACVKKQVKFLGASLLALHSGELSREDYLRDAKRLLRIALGKLLGDKPIKSRELFL